MLNKLLGVNTCEAQRVDLWQNGALSGMPAVDGSDGHIGATAEWSQSRRDEVRRYAESSQRYRPCGRTACFNEVDYAAAPDVNFAGCWLVQNTAAADALPASHRKPGQGFKPVA